MYSVVLMAALTTSVDLPDLGGRRGGGCCGCYGGGYGYGCMGMGYGGCMGMGYGGGYGCMGMGMGMGYGGGCYGGGMMMQGAIQQGTSGERLKTTPKTKGNNETMAPAPATIVVELPADAKLLFDNEATNSTGASRVFESPVLNPGKTYHYNLKAEAVRAGKSVRIEKVVEIKAGEITQVSLTLPTVSVAQR